MWIGKSSVYIGFSTVCNLRHLLRVLEWNPSRPNGQGGNLKLPWCSDSEESACSAENPGSIPKSGRSPREKNGYPLRYSCQDNSMDRGTWQAIVHRIAESKDWVINTFTFTKTYSQSRWLVSCRIRTWICLSVSKTHFIPLFIFITFD